MSTPLVMLVRSLHVGGLEKMVIELSRQLARRGTPAEIWCVEERGVLAEDAEAQGIAVRSLDKGLGLSPRTILRLRRWLREAGVQVVHSHNPLAHFYAALAAAGQGRVHVVHTSHQMWMPQNWRQLQYSRLASRFTDYMIGVSDAVRESACAELRVPEARTGTILNGIDLSPYLALAPVTERPPDAPLVGTVGRLHPVKNHALLLEAVAGLDGEPDAGVRIVGDGELAQSLRERAAALGLDERLQLPGVRSDIADQLAALDVFVLSSDFEGMPLVLVEAMAAARPIVATRVGGIPEMVEDGVHGLLVPRRDPAAMAAAIGRLLSDRSLARQLGLAARERARSRYDVAIMSDAYLALYEKWL